MHGTETEGPVAGKQVKMKNNNHFFQSVQHFHRLLALRQRTDREFYLFDASPWFESDPADATAASLSSVKIVLSNVSVDVDDDVFLFANLGVKNASKQNLFYENSSDAQNASIAVWEVYRVHVSTPLTILPYANYTKAKGLKITAAGEKWQRRRDLQVSPDIQFEEMLQK